MFFKLYHFRNKIIITLLYYDSIYILKQIKAYPIYIYITFNIFQNIIMKLFKFYTYTNIK